jgi:hypothetical protein
MPTTTIETRGVLAGAYRGHNRVGEMLTHSIVVQRPSGGEKVLCRRVRVEHLADPYAFTPDELAAPPTCGECLRRDPRFSQCRHTGDTYCLKCGETLESAHV